MKIMLAVCAAMGIAGCASLSPAQMVLPAPLTEGADRITVTGISGGEHGVFVAGSFSGDFARSDTRLAIFDPLFERRDGWTRFTFNGPDIEGKIAGDCRMRERAVTLGDISFEPQPMAYRCDFSHEGRRLAARLEVQARREGIGGLLMRQERRGEIAWDSVVVHIRSAHKVQGSAIEMATPIGYLFEQNGAIVGAVEINGEPVISVAPSIEPAARRAVIVAAMALGLFWDPVHSALGREAG